MLTIFALFFLFLERRKESFRASLLELVLAESGRRPRGRVRFFYDGKRDKRTHTGYTSWKNWIFRSANAYGSTSYPCDDNSTVTIDTLPVIEYISTEHNVKVISYKLYRRSYLMTSLPLTLK